MRELRKKFAQAGVESDDIYDLLGEDPSLQADGEIRDRGRMSPIREG